MTQTYITCFGAVALDQKMVDAICRAHPFCLNHHSMETFIQGDIRQRLQNDSRSGDLKLFALTSDSDVWIRYLDIIEDKAKKYQEIVDTTSIYVDNIN